MPENYKDDVYTHAVRAGKRTYFFDVKATRGKDLFMTITESKRIYGDENAPAQYEKHKIFLYKEDFQGFIDGLQQAIDHIRELQGRDGFRSAESVRKGHEDVDGNIADSATKEITFEDLD